MISRFLILLLPALVLSYSGADVIRRAANTWVTFPVTNLIRVTPPGDTYGSLFSMSGVAAITSCWSGGAYDIQDRQMIVWGGGHNDYYGNELYAFKVDSMKWVRLTNPTLNPNLCNDANSDGTPNSRHTYNGLAYIAHVNRFFGSGGALACPPGSCGANKAWCYNLTAGGWQNRNPSGSGPATACEDNCAYDPYTKKVYYFAANGLFAYDYDGNTWTNINGNGRYNYTCAVDTKRHLLFNIGHGSVLVFDLTKTPLSGTEWNTTGGTNFISGGAVGIDYDPVSDKLVGYNGGSVYALDIDTKVWTTYTPSPAPSTPIGYGAYGRWRYAPDVNAFIFVTSNVNDNIFFYKFTAGGPGKVDQGPNKGKQGPSLSISPNPLNTVAKISFNTDSKNLSQASLLIYDLQGRLITDLSADIKDGETIWNTVNIPAGIYVVTMKSKAGVFSRKCLIAK